jgi:hypothetical protein
MFYQFSFANVDARGYGWYLILSGDEGVLLVAKIMLGYLNYVLDFGWGILLK